MLNYTPKFSYNTFMNVFGGIQVAPPTYCLDWDNAQQLAAGLAEALNLPVKVVFGPPGPAPDQQNWQLLVGAAAWLAVETPDRGIVKVNAGVAANYFLHGSSPDKVIAQIKNELGLQ